MHILIPSFLPWFLLFLFMCISLLTGWNLLNTLTKICSQVEVNYSTSAVCKSPDRNLAEHVVGQANPKGRLVESKLSTSKRITVEKCRIAKPSEFINKTKVWVAESCQALMWLKCSILKFDFLGCLRKMRQAPGLLGVTPTSELCPRRITASLHAGISYFWIK